MSDNSNEDAKRAFQTALELQQSGRLAEAERAWEALRAQFPDHGGINVNLASVLWRQGRLDAAAEVAERAVVANPDMAEAHTILGAAAEAQGRTVEAMKALKRAVELKPEIVTAWVGLALLCKGAGEFAEALEACACAEALEPGRVDVGNARAELYLAQGDLDAALKGFDRVLAQLPSTEEAHNGRGNVLCGLARGAEARAAYDAAIAINPEFPDPYFNRGLLALCEGRWSEGWPDYERRWQTRQMGPFQRGFAQQQWDGADRPDQTLLLHAEQCMGDTMQFIRYAPLAAERVGRVVLESQAPVMALLTGTAGIDEFVEQGADLPAFDVHLPLLSLPGVFGTEPDTVPADIPYITAPSDRPALPDGAGFKVGLAWAGSPANPSDLRRSMDLDVLRPLLDVSRCTFYSLQHGPAGDQIDAAGLSGKLHDLRPVMSDFVAMAGLIGQLDLVISICTSVAHLSGAMGAETWVMLSADADWRWLKDRNDTPWYPTMRLFRQDTLGDWPNMVVDVISALVRRAA